MLIDTNIYYEILLYCKIKKLEIVEKFEFVKNKDHNTLTQSKYKLSDFIHDLETKRIKISPCCGCYPIFQPNQLAHLDGCLSCSVSDEEYDI